jgi:hypothetical protein
MKALIKHFSLVHPDCFSKTLWFHQKQNKWNQHSSKLTHEFAILAVASTSQKWLWKDREACTHSTAKANRSSGISECFLSLDRLCHTKLVTQNQHGGILWSKPLASRFTLPDAFQFLADGVDDWPKPKEWKDRRKTEPLNWSRGSDQGGIVVVDCHANRIMLTKVVMVVVG